MRPRCSAVTLAEPQNLLLGVSWKEVGEQRLWCQEGPSRAKSMYKVRAETAHTLKACELLEF